MHASSLFVLAGAAAVMATQTTTSTSTMTAYVTLTKCDAAHPDCPLHTSTSSAAVSTSSAAAPSSSAPAPAYSVQAHQNTTVASYPTAQHNATKPKYTMSGTAPITIQTSIPADAPTQGESYPTAAPSPSPIPETSAAGAVSLRSGLLVAALGAVAAALV